MSNQEQSLMEKIRGLPPEKISEVEDFVDFLLMQNERRLTRAATKLSEDAFRKVWDNPEDSVYDNL